MYKFNYGLLAFHMMSKAAMKIVEIKKYYNLYTFGYSFLSDIQRYFLNALLCFCCKQTYKTFYFILFMSYFLFFARNSRIKTYEQALKGTTL